MAMVQGMMEINVSYETRTRVNTTKYITIKEWEQLRNKFSEVDMFAELEQRFTDEVPDYIAESIWIDGQTY